MNATRSSGISARNRSVLAFAPAVAILHASCIFGALASFSFATARAQDAKPKSVEIRAEAMAGLAAALAPYRNNANYQLSPVEAKGFDILRQEHLIDGPPPSARKGLANALGAAMLLGNRTQQFLPELAMLNDAIALGKNNEIRAAIIALQQKAGRSPPSDAALEKMVVDASAAAAGLAPPPQHVSLSRPDYSIDIDSSPSAGITRVHVVTSGGPDGNLQRVTFSADQKSAPNAAKNDIDAGLTPAPTRVMGGEEAAKLHAGLNGQWTDQDGFPWDITGTGDALTLTHTNPNGHRVAYSSKWSLGLIDGTHPVDHPEDLSHDLPEEVRQALASRYHPPFTVKLEFLPDRDQLSGLWISGRVTYGGAFHDISVVEDPTWDRPLVLERLGERVAQGGRYPQEGP
jgi:hypothetical protein